MIDEKKLLLYLNDWALQEAPKFNDKENDKYKTIKECIKTVEEQQKAGEWIPVEERLPDHYCNCIVTISNRLGEDVDIDTYVEFEGAWGWQSWHEGSRRNIIAWMPLPELYKPQPEPEWKEKILRGH